MANIDPNSLDFSLYPFLYGLYLSNPYNFIKSEVPFNNLLITTEIYTKWESEVGSFILQISDISTGTPKPIISKSGSFWEEIKTEEDNLHIFITIDGTEILIEKGYQIYHYDLIQDPDQQSTGAVNNG